MTTVVIVKRDKRMFYIACFLIGIILVGVSGVYFIQKRDYVDDFRERYNIYIGTKDITVTTPGGVTIGLAVSRNDREVAWKIYSQLATRLAIVDFNENYDSFFLANQSLQSLFAFVREQLSQIPVERIRRDKSDELINFYTSILNDGIRPYLSKWHMPISGWIESQKKNNPDATYYELEKMFPQRPEALKDMKEMNQRMKKMGEQLLRIVRAS